MAHPNTPDIHNPISKRMFDGQVPLGHSWAVSARLCSSGPDAPCSQIRAWRRALHDWEDPTSKLYKQVHIIVLDWSSPGSSWLKPRGLKLTACGLQMLLEGGLLSPGSCTSDRPASYAGALSGSAPSSRAPSEAGATPRTAATPSTRQVPLLKVVQIRQLAADLPDQHAACSTMGSPHTGPGVCWLISHSGMAPEEGRLTCRQDDVAEMLAPVRARRQPVPGAARNPPPPAADKVRGRTCPRWCLHYMYHSSVPHVAELPPAVHRLPRACRSAWLRP